MTTEPQDGLFCEIKPPAPRRPGRPSNHEAAQASPANQPPQTAKPPKKASKTKGKTNSQGKAKLGINSAYINKIDNPIYGSNISDQIDNHENLPEVIDNIGEIIKGFNSKEKLTAQELKFIECHLIRKYTIKRSMILAGYEFNSEGMYFYTGKKIIIKFEAQAEDHRQIMRAIGAGEVFIISGMLDLARNSTSEIVKKDAYATLGRWIGMDKDLIQGSQGVTVIIKGYEGAQQQVNVLPQRPQDIAINHPQPSTPGGTVTITK